jgi:hypothetical protein
MRALLLTVLLAAACGSSNKNNQDDGGAPDLAMSPGNADLSMVTNPDLSETCVTDPMTHLELINACTTADSVDKLPFYPTLAPNGQLPPLP